jgi:hypothetical protein
MLAGLHRQRMGLTQQHAAAFEGRAETRLEIGEQGADLGGMRRPRAHPDAIWSRLGKAQA